jgi:acetylornithine deacetylase/succinyl-diaminopimelate desuccinylase-like protein
MSHENAVALTRSLLRFDTVNPPGRERDCARYVGAMLQEWGYSVEFFEHADARTSVVARDVPHRQTSADDGIADPLYREAACLYG